MKNTKPAFKYTPPSIGTISVNDKIFNVSPIGPASWINLRNANYGEDERRKFGFGTFGQEYILVTGAYLNQEEAGAKGIVDTIRRLGVTGNTGLYGGENDLMFAVDCPEVRNKRIILPDEKTLVSKLSKKQVGKVIFSDDGLVRAMPREVREGEYSSLPASISDYPTFLTGLEDAGELTAQTLDNIRKPGYFLIPSKKAIRVPDLFEDDDRLFLGGNGWVGLNDSGFSFGVRQ